MSFSARDAILNDDEEWFNIPAVVRSFLRQLNNEVHNNHLTCTSLLQNQQEHDKLLKGFTSKQMERELEMTRTVLTLRQERHEVESSLHGVVDNIREQMRLLSEEQHQIRDRIRQIEEREHDAIALQDSLRAQLNSLCKTLNHRSAELEMLLHNSVDGLSKSVTELEKGVRVVTEKQNSVMSESKNEIERFNAVLQQVCSAVSEEVDGLRGQMQEHRQALEELRSVDREEVWRCEREMKAVSRVRERVDDAVKMIKQIETSSDKRFESVFNALEKSQALTSKLSSVHQQRGEDHSSLMSTLQETRDMQSALAEELRSNLDEQSKTIRGDLDGLKRRISDMFSSRDEVVSLVNERVGALATKSSEEAICRRIDTLEAMVPKVILRVEMEGLLNDAMTNQHTMRENNYMEVHRTISQQRNVLQGELDYLKATVGNLDIKCEQMINAVRKVENVGDTLQTVVGRVQGFEGAIETMRGDIDTVTNVVKSFHARIPARTDLPKENEMPRIASKLKEEEEEAAAAAAAAAQKRSIADATAAILDEVKSLTDEMQRKLSEHDTQLSEVQRNLLRYDTLVKEIPRSYQRYMDAVDQKLSPALLELDFLRERVASFELGRLPARQGEGVQNQSNADRDENGIEEMRLKVQQTQTLHSIQRQLQAVDVRVDGVGALVQSLERKVQAFSSEISDMSNTALSTREQEQQREVLVRNELQRLSTQLHELEDGVRASGRGAAQREQSLHTLVSNLASVQESIDNAFHEIKVLDRVLRGCITATSPEWKGLCEELAALSRSIQGKGLQSLLEERDNFAPLSRVAATEEVLVEIRRELRDLALHLQHVKESMAGKTRLDSLLQDEGSTCQESLLVIGRRVGHLEETLRKDQSRKQADVGDTIASIEVRLQSLEIAGADLQLKQSAMASSSSSAASLLSGAMQRVTTLEERVGKLEGAAAPSGGEGEMDTVLHVSADPVVLDRLSALEGAVVACTNGMARSTESVSILRGHVEQLEGRLSAFVEKMQVNSKPPAVADAFNGGNLKDVVGRLEQVESAISGVHQVALAQKDDAHAGYSRAQVDSRFETMWASFIALLTRKEDQESVEQKLAELRREVTDSLVVQINTVVRELQRAIEERVSVTEVRELLRGVRE